MRSTLAVVLLHRAIAPVCSLLPTAPAAAQCGIDWLLNGGLPGVNAPANVAAWWDPDGSGSGPEVVVVGGSTNFDPRGGGAFPCYMLDDSCS